MKILRSALVGTILWIGGYSAGLAMPVTVTVDCDTPGDGDFDSISDALDTLADSIPGELIIQFSGTCDEAVGISKSGVTLVGAGGSPTIGGTVGVKGATNVELRDFKIIDTSGGAEATRIAIADGSSVFARDLVIEDGSFNVGQNSGADLRDSQITGLGDSPAVEVANNSFIRLRQDNVILGGGALIPAVFVTVESSVVALNAPLSITNPGGGDAVLVERGSFGELRRGTYTGGITVDFHSAIIIRSTATVDGSITLSRDSGAVNDRDPDKGPVMVTGDVTCLDDDSSISGEFLVTGTVSCTGFSKAEATKKTKK